MRRLLAMAFLYAVTYEYLKIIRILTNFHSESIIEKIYCYVGEGLYEE